MTNGSQTLEDFSRRYALRAPQYPPLRGRIESECVQIEGLLLLAEAPVANFQQGYPPLARSEQGTNTYIWVIDLTGVPYIIGVHLKTLGGERPRHTNLTGDKDAYVGGELWFRTESSLYISGGSGRYPPLCEDQLKDAVTVFEAFGYEVISLGWDGTGAKRYLEEL